MLEKFKIKYDDHGHAFINAKDVYDALEVKSVGFKTWWKDMIEDTGFRKSFDFIIENKKIYVTPEMAKYFCREWNIQTAHKNDCAVEIRRGYQISDLVEATEYFAKSECLSECVGCDEGIINAINKFPEIFVYKDKPMNVFNFYSQYLFSEREIQRILGMSVSENCAYKLLNADEVVDLVLSSKSPEARDFHIWFVRDVLSQLGAN